MDIIETKDLTKRFGSITAVDSVSLSVRRGEVFGFLGPNGAGKSTTISMLLGYLQPSEGTGTIFGHDIESRSRAIRRRTGVLPEGTDLYELMTGREHLELAAEIHGVDADTEAILDRVGLIPKARDRLAREYSKGMRQRVSLGMALVGDPDLLILDEPSTGLDPTGMGDMRSIIREEAASGTTVFFSSHILSEVEAVCDRVGIMNHAKLVTVDTLDDLRSDRESQCTIDCTLESVPELDGLREHAGVVEITRDGTTVSVTCEQSRQKADVVRYLDDRTEIIDIVSEQRSLESIFEQYTNSGVEDQTTTTAGENQPANAVATPSTGADP
jgi:ABC-2 type transport system ATP-binding protein